MGVHPLEICRSGSWFFFWSTCTWGSTRWKYVVLALGFFFGPHEHGGPPLSRKAFSPRWCRSLSSLFLRTSLLSFPQWWSPLFLKRTIQASSQKKKKKKKKKS